MIDFPELKFSDTIFAEPGKSDDLKRDLQALREALVEMDQQSKDTGIALSAVAADLHLMEEKTAFFAALADKTTGLFVPPPPGDGEKATYVLQSYIFSRLDIASITLSLMSTPLVADMFFSAATKLKWAKEGRLVSRVMTSGKYLKLMKVAKASMYLAMAVELVNYALELYSASKLNAQLEAELRELKEMRDKARKEYAALCDALTEARKLRDDLLAAAKVTTVSAYVRHLNEAIADVGRRKAVLETARRMLQHGLTSEAILPLLDGVTEEVLDQIARRLQAEERLAAGGAIAQVAAALALGEDQVAQVARLVEARDALIRGEELAAIAGRLALSQARLEEADDRLEAALPGYWSQIEAEDGLDTIAAALILHVAALEDLHRELVGKALILGGKETGEVAGALRVSRDQIVRWATALPAAREAAHALAGDGKLSPAEIAATTRLPLAGLGL